MKIKNVIVILVILIIILLAVLFGKGNSSKSIKITPETKKEIITLVNNYYNNMMNKDYESALKLIDLEKSNYDMGSLFNGI